MISAEELARLPEGPGVYLMKDASGAILYVGKAKNLKKRVRQYYLGTDTRAMIPLLTERTHFIDTVLVSSEKEALLLENTLIKQHWPHYNALLKDDSSFCSLRISNHEWPSCEIVRLRSVPTDRAQYFGPYPSASAARTALDLIQQLFPLRRCSDRELASRTRPCILYDMKRCLAPCVDRCTQEEYDKVVQQVERFLQGKDQAVLQSLREERDLAAENLDFEQAHRLQQILQSLEQVFEEQSVDQPTRFEADVWGIYREGDEVVLAQLFIRNGKLSGLRNHHFQHVLEESDDLVSSILLQIYAETAPPVILLGWDLPDAALLAEILSTQHPVTLSHPKRGHKAQLIEMAQRNAVAGFQRASSHAERQERILSEMQAQLRLTHYPEGIEITDTSHLGGQDSVAVMVCYQDGERATERYRKYILKTALGGDDYEALREVLRRRFRTQADAVLPQLLLIDGGKAHLEVACAILEELNIAAILDVVAIGKESGRHDRGMSQETLWIRDQSQPILLSVHSPLLLFLQRMRDEAHRFAIEFQRSRRGKTSMRSALQSIPGIGPVKRRALLNHFGSVARIRSASIEEWAACPGINRRDLLLLQQWVEGRKPPPIEPSSESL